MMRKLITIDVLISESVRDVLSTGNTPMVAAEHVFAKYKKSLLPEIAERLMLIGLGKSVADAMANGRHMTASKPKLPKWHISKWREIHDEVCPFSHKRQERKCVVRLFGDIDYSDDEAIRAAIERESERAEETRERLSQGEIRQTLYLTEWIRESLTKYTREILGGIVLEGADGRMRPLINFSIDDVSMWRNKAAKNESSWAARRSWFDKSYEEMSAAKVTHLEEIEISRLGKLAEAAEEVWAEAGAVPMRHPGLTSAGAPYPG